MSEHTSTLFLIAHKVRGERAFDVAIQVECPECTARDEPKMACFECEDTGRWWIIPTSGHRAYPYWFNIIEADWYERSPDMPEGLPDHYRPRAVPAVPKLNILALLPKAPSGPSIRRRV